MSDPPDLTRLLAWYDRHRRHLPWRAEPGEVADPYRVWLSEIMLQQTTVTAVIPYFEAFLARFPTVGALAAAPLSDVLSAWAGLGYYARARNLHACAQRVAAEGFPRDPAGLRGLPGIGPYTAAAIGAIAFGHNVIPVDGNVERVVARLFAITDPLPAAKSQIGAEVLKLATQAGARARPSDTAQALFDLGATVCTPTTPDCLLCPLNPSCGARRAGIAADLPRKAARKVRPHRYGVHFWLADAQGRVLLRRRPATGLLGGMTELPGAAWRAEPWGRADALGAAPMPAAWAPAGRVEHGFTHFTLSIDLFAAQVPHIEADGFLRDVRALGSEALPSVMRKCVAMAETAGPWHCSHEHSTTV
jgi:A/G-specific adenine glycosylase